VLVALLAVSMAASGCERQRPAPEPTANPTAIAVPPAEEAAPSSVELVMPVAGAAVSSPVQIAGRLDVAPGRTVAAQVRSLEVDGSLRWRGNGPVAFEEDGTFASEIPYRLSTERPGTVEVLVIDPVSGTVLERASVEVTLGAAR
jgi:hypothetical protein